MSILKILVAPSAGLALWCIATAAHADPAYDQCIDAASDNATWAQCGGDFVQREDAQLNTVWREIYGRASTQTKPALLAEQRAWIAFREAACKYWASGEFGREGQVLSFPSCVAEVIAARTVALQGIGKELDGPTR